MYAYMSKYVYMFVYLYTHICMLIVFIHESHLVFIYALLLYSLFVCLLYVCMLSDNGGNKISYLLSY